VTAVKRPLRTWPTANDPPADVRRVRTTATGVVVWRRVDPFHWVAPGWPIPLTWPQVLLFGRATEERDDDD
jgi:hypothetical protein